ncbi:MULTISPECIES: DedA family protein [Paenarthrobacter]|uniref:DedA family protein n=1 Tax=Paenarthrobacter TaxID=1742992 RepID=UPI00236532D7|nr:MULTISPECIES: DedA family protein [Paenarthrobacter]MDD7833718.1 DedA family protein [Paenarthrobacter sp. AB444]MDP9933980.1 membrane protein DedA with SNARE-associated domain [Paenarthrobacter nicotinovorans]
MGGFIDGLLSVSPALAYTLVALFVFAEDAFFLGFVIPGETAAVLGGVIASRGEVQLGWMMALVVLAAIIGDTVGYEVGRHAGTRLLESRALKRHREKLGKAQEFLRRRGGAAVFLGRFVAFFRAVMPALAGTSHMHYPRFLAFNAAGGLVWGVGFVLLGYLAGNSYEVVAKVVGRDITAVAVALALVAVVIWRIRSARRKRRDALGS